MGRGRSLLQQGYRLHKLLQTSIKFHYRYADLHSNTRYYSTLRDIKKNYISYHSVNVDFFFNRTDKLITSLKHIYCINIIIKSKLDDIICSQKAV